MAQTHKEASDGKIVVALKTFVAGGIAGCCAKTSVAPLDRVKILLQAHSEHYKHLGVFSTVKHVVRKEGFVGLYQGNGVQLLRIFPYAALQFLSYEHFKRLFKDLQILQSSPGVSKMICGTLAGFTAVVITYPLDMVRARLAFQVKGDVVYSGIVDTVKTIRLSEGGTRGLYQGIVPTIVGMAPYAGLSFSSFEMMKNFALDTFPDYLAKPCPHNTGGLVLIMPATLICGGLAGAFAQTFSYPLDVVRRKMQLSGMVVKAQGETTPYQRGWVRVLIDVYQADGITKGLFRGMSINYLRIMPTVAISFATYEAAKQFFGLDTGIDR